MSENTATKQNPVTTVRKFVAKHDRKILIATTLVSTSCCVLMKSGVAQHNAFLKEHGLYNEFYQITTPEA